MKKTIILIIAVILLCSCGKDKQKDKEPGLFDLIDNVSDLNKIAEEAENIEEEKDKLLKATPLSNEEIKAFLPEKLLDFPRKKFSVGNEFMADMTMAEAHYENENDEMISFSILDGAGETGSSIVTLSRLGFARDFEEQTDWGYKKSVTINGYKAVEEVERDEYDDNVTTKIDFIISGRFVLSIEGRKIPIEKLKKAIGELDLKTLEEKAD